MWVRHIHQISSNLLKKDLLSPLIEIRKNSEELISTPEHSYTMTKLHQGFMQGKTYCALIPNSHFQPDTSAEATLDSYTHL